MTPTRPTLLARALVAAVLVLAVTGCAAAEETGADATATSTPSPSATQSDGTPSSAAPSGPTGSPSETVPASGTASPGGSDTSDAPEREVDVEVEIEEGEVSPTGDRIDASVGAPVVVRIRSDVPGEIHIHSSPEQAIEFDAGTSVHEIVIDRPGIVDVELHEPSVTLVQLEVR